VELGNLRRLPDDLQIPDDGVERLVVTLELLARQAFRSRASGSSLPNRRKT